MNGWDEIPDSQQKAKPKADSWDSIPDSWGGIPEASAAPAPVPVQRSTKDLRANEEALGLEGSDSGSLLDKAGKWAKTKFKTAKQAYLHQVEVDKQKTFADKLKEASTKLLPDAGIGMKTAPEVLEGITKAGQSLLRGGYLPWGADTEERNARELAQEIQPTDQAGWGRVDEYLSEADRIRREAAEQRKSDTQWRTNAFNRLKDIRNKAVGAPSGVESFAGNVAKFMGQAEFAPWSIIPEAWGNAASETAEAPDMSMNDRLKYATAQALVQGTFQKMPVGRLTEAALPSALPGVARAGLGVVADASSQTALDSLLRQNYGAPAADPNAFLHNVAFSGAMRLPHGGFGGGASEDVRPTTQADLLAPGTPQPTTVSNPEWATNYEATPGISAEFAPRSRTVVAPDMQMAAGNVDNPLSGGFKRTFVGDGSAATPEPQMDIRQVPEDVARAKNSQEAGILESHRKSAISSVEPVIGTLGQQIAKDRLILASLEGKKNLNKRDQRRADDLREKISLAESEQLKTKLGAETAGALNTEYALSFASGDGRQAEAPRNEVGGQPAPTVYEQPSSASGRSKLGLGPVGERRVRAELPAVEESAPFQGLRDVEWGMRQIKKGRIADLLGIGNVVTGLKERGGYFDASPADISLARDYVDIQKRNASNPDAPPRPLPELTPNSQKIVDVLRPQIDNAVRDYVSARAAKGVMASELPGDHIPRVTLERGEEAKITPGASSLRETSGFERGRTIKAIVTPEGDVPISIDGDTATDASGNTYKKSGKGWSDPDSGGVFHEVEATKSGVEAAFPRIKYLDDPLGSILLGRYSNRDAARTANFAQRLTQNRDLAVPEHEAPPTWQSVEVPGMPTLKGMKFRPDVAQTITAEANAWHKAGASELPESKFVKTVNAGMSNLISLTLSNPVVHWPNLFDHAMTSFESVNGKIDKGDYLGNWIESAKHLKAGDATVQEAVQAGLNLTTGAKRANKVIDQLRESFNIPETSKVLKSLGADHEGALKFLDSMSDKSVWTPQDINMLTNYLTYRKKGLNPEQAAKASHKSYVSYEMPTQLVEMSPSDSPQLASAKAMVNKLYGGITGTTLVPGSAGQATQRLLGPMFVKYHYGVLKQIVNKAKIAFEGDPQAANKATALALLNLALYPAADQLLTNLFGDKEEKLEVRRGGSSHFAHLAMDPTMSTAQKAMRFSTPAPLARAAGAYLLNTDINTGNQFATREDRVTGDTAQHWKALATESFLPHGISAKRAAEGDVKGSIAQQMLGKRVPKNETSMYMYKLMDQKPTPDDLLQSRKDAQAFKRAVDANDDQSLESLIGEAFGTDAPISSIKSTIKRVNSSKMIDTVQSAKGKPASIIVKGAEFEEDQRTKALLYLKAAEAFGREARSFGPDSPKGKESLNMAKTYIRKGSGLLKLLSRQSQ